MKKLLPILIFIVAIQTPDLFAGKMSSETKSVISHFRDHPVDKDGNRIPNDPEREREFQGFWKHFRKAVIKSKWDDLMKLVHFPLETRGSMDSDPVLPVSKVEFQKVFEAYLSEEDHLRVIQELKKVNPYIVDSWVRISDMHFRRIGGSWRLTWIYIDISQYE